MFESWKQVENDVNKKEAEKRAGKASAPIIDLPPELQEYITETIPNDVELTGEESVLAELRLDNVRKAARAFHEIDKKKEKLHNAKFEFEKRFIITSGQNRPPQIIEAMRKIDNELAEAEVSIKELMQSNPEAYIVRNALELRSYRKQLKDSDFVLTPYGERKLQELEDNYYSMDKVPFLNGETGSGKSSIAKYFCKEVLKSDSERIAGAKGIDETKIFGKISLTSDEKGPQAVFVKGPLYVAMEKGLPLIIEEVNAIPPEILKSLNDIVINAKKGDEVPVIGDPQGSRVKARPGFGVIMTGNLNRNPKAIDRYKGLFELSADFVNRIRPIDYDYLPQSTEGNHIEEAGEGNELYTLMIAMIMNDKGDVNAPEGVFDDLWRLAKFTRKIQEVYSGQRDGKLFSRQGGLEVPVTATSSVVSMRDIKQTIESWKRDNFKNELDYYIYKELIAPLTNTMDVRFFVQQLQAEGFLADESWKDVVAKAGTFDSAIHAPENPGKELEFMTVRNVVENVYGKAPERREVPYDLEIINKSALAVFHIKKTIEGLKSELESRRRFSYGDLDEESVLRLNEIILSAEARLEKIIEVKEKFAKADFNRDVNEFLDLNKNLKKIVDEVENDPITRMKEILDGLSSQQYEYSKLVQRTVGEKELLEGLVKTYVPEFNIDENFINGHKQILETITDAEKILGNNANGEPLTIADLQKERTSLEIKAAALKLKGLDFSNITSRINELDSKKNEYFKKIRGVIDTSKFKYDETYYLRLNEQKIIQGAQADMIYNVNALKKEGKYEDRYGDEIVERMHISIDENVRAIFDNPKVIFKNQRSTTLQRFYHAKFYRTEVLDGCSLSINEMKQQLSGFCYTEPWMILGFIHKEESWMLGARDTMKDLKELFRGRVLFCVKDGDNNDALVSVVRKGDCEWEITLETSDANRIVVTEQFIAPQIINPVKEKKVSVAE